MQLRIGLAGKAMARPLERLREDEASKTIIGFMHLMAYIVEHEPTSEEVQIAMGLSKPTFKRRLALARALGITIVCKPRGIKPYYVVEDFGPLSRAGLLKLRERAGMPPSTTPSTRPASRNTPAAVDE